MSKIYNKEFYDHWKQWALKRCEAWNFNADIPEIAKQIHEIDAIKSDSSEFAVLKDVFNEYFGKDGNPPVISQFEAITQCLEHLESNP